MIAWRTDDDGLLVAFDGDTLVARVFKDGCEWLVVGAIPPSAFKKRGEATDYVEREYQRRSDAVPGPVGAGAGPAG